MKSIYIAAPYECAKKAKDVSDLFKRMGLTVTSTWYEPDVIKTENLDWSDNIKCRCLCEIDDADIFLLLNLPSNNTTGGKDFEMGFAEAKGKIIYIFGKKTNIYTDYNLRYESFLDLQLSILDYCSDNNVNVETRVILWKTFS